MFVTPFTDTEINLNIKGFNDELSHINNVDYIYHNHALAVQTRSVQDKDWLIYNDVEYYQPPLYYLLCQPLYALGSALLPQAAKAGNKIYPFTYYTPRIMSALWGTLTIYVLYLIGACFSTHAGTLAALYLSLMPAHVRFSSLASNDSLSWLLAGGFLYLLMSKTWPERNLRHHLMTGLFIATGLYCKTSFLALLPLMFLEPVIYFIKYRSYKPIVTAGVILGSSLLAISPWYIRNYIIYGSALALHVGSGEPVEALMDFNSYYWYRFISYSIMSYWFPFNLELNLPIIPKVIDLFFTALCLGGALWLAAKKYGSFLRDIRYQTAALCALLALAGYLRFNMLYHQAESRLAFVGLPAFILITVLSMEFLLPRKSTRTYAVLAFTILPYLYLLG